jgi:Flp pilus assembly protein TadD
MASNADDHIVQGNLLVGQGRYDRAVAEYTEAIRIEPRSALAYMGRGVARAKAGRVKRAIADQTEATRIDPGLAAAFRNRGRDHWTRGAVKSALADFTEAIRLEPRDAGAYCDRATVYNRLGKFDLGVRPVNHAGIRPDPAR